VSQEAAGTDVEGLRRRRENIVREHMVARYFEETRTAFPDQRNEPIALHHAEDAVLFEAILYATHDGPFGGLPPTRALAHFSSRERRRSFSTRPPVCSSGQ
jgi:SnoaL-like polyketide cyclase